MSTVTKRKTLVQIQGEMGVRDPFGYANSQVRELEMTAMKSKIKKVSKLEEIEKAKVDLNILDQQILLINGRYKDLCKHLDESKNSRADLMRIFEACKKDSMGVNFH
jgi:hypothetical protein